MSKSDMLPELPSADAGTHIPRSPEVGAMLDHDAALQALIDCSRTTVLLSYEEVFEGYFKLRGLDGLLAALKGGGRGAPKGWQLVPKTPTAEMIDATMHVSREYGATLRDCAEDLWDAMLSEAPSPEGGAS